MSKNTLYIVVEGVVGTGKSTQVKKIHKWLTKKYPKKEIILTREPGGTEIAEEIRRIVQGTKHEENMGYVCEAYLYAAARSQSLRKIFKEKPTKKTIVISDRSFLTSVANQGEGRKVGIDNVLEINKKAIEGFIPDIVLYLDLDIKVGLSRAFDHGGDKFESLGIDFYKRVQKGYKKIQKTKGYFNLWINIDARGTKKEVFSKIKESLEKLIR